MVEPVANPGTPAPDAGTPPATPPVTPPEPVDQNKAVQDAAIKAEADKVAADKAVTDLAEEHKGIADKAIADHEAAKKAAADKAAGVKDPADGDPDAGKGAPETYETFAMPEGMEVDTEKLDLFIPLAKDANLTQAQAQTFVDMFTAEQEAMLEHQQQVWLDTREGWVGATAADPEIGGQNADGAVANAKLFLKQFGTPELMSALETSGMGDHPEVIRILSRAGKAIGEDKIIVARGAMPEQQKTHAQAIFGGPPVK